MDLIFDTLKATGVDTGPGLLGGIPVFINDLVPPGQIWMGNDLGHFVIYASKHDRNGYQASLFPTPLYTKYTRGMHELARDNRRRWKRAKHRKHS